MKAFKTNGKKMVLKKVTISNLESIEMRHLQGGSSATGDEPCVKPPTMDNRPFCTANPPDQNRTSRTFEQ